MEQQAVSRVLAIEAGEGLTPERLAQETTELVEDLAEQLSAHGTVPGHIKALVEEEGEFAMFTCTRIGRTQTRFSAGWKSYSPHWPVLRLNVIVVGLPEGSVASALDEALASSTLGFGIS